MPSSEHLVLVTEQPAFVKFVDEVVSRGLPGVALEHVNSLVPLRRLLIERPVSVAVTDLTLPFGTGFGALHEVQRQQPFSPVICASENVEPRRIQQALEGGAFDLVRKLIPARQLIPVVQHALRVYRLRHRVQTIEQRLHRLHRLRIEAQRWSVRPAPRDQLSKLLVPSFDRSYRLSIRVMRVLRQRLTEQERKLAASRLELRSLEEAADLRLRGRLDRPS